MHTLISYLPDPVVAVRDLYRLTAVLSETLSHVLRNLGYNRLVSAATNIALNPDKVVSDFRLHNGQRSSVKRDRHDIILAYVLAVIQRTTKL